MGNRCVMLILSFTVGLPGGCVQDDAVEITPIESWANRYDRQRAEVLERRAADWRNGAIIYQVIVDRFAPPADAKKKQELYPAPKRLRKWSETPKPLNFVESAGVYQHEIDFWGGDLKSLRSRLDYIQDLGVDVLYLNPIHEAYTNHKYDALDYFAVSSEYGTRDDVKELAEACHQREMKIVLDGVFNHVGKRCPWFVEASTDPNGPYREWFYFGDEYQHGYRAWANVANLPELRSENPTVAARIYGDEDSVVQGYLRDGIDGWRLDVAFDLGFVGLDRLTRSAHAAKPGSLVVGEIWNYPEEWMPAVDGLLNFYYRELIFHMLGGHVSGRQAGLMIDRMIADTGLEPLLKSWVVLDNHDTARLTHVLPDLPKRHFAQALQFTLPGSPCIYYGAEVGMEGGQEPECRAPMRWDLVRDDNSDYVWMRALIDLRKRNRALRIGDFRWLPSERLLAFMRQTDRVRELVVVVANPTGADVTDVIPMRDAKVMNWTQLKDHFSDARTSVDCGMFRITVPPYTVRILKPEIDDSAEYSAYKRIQ